MKSVICRFGGPLRSSQCLLRWQVLLLFLSWKSMTEWHRFQIFWGKAKYLFSFLQSSLCLKTFPAVHVFGSFPLKNRVFLKSRLKQFVFHPWDVVTKNHTREALQSLVGCCDLKRYLPLHCLARHPVVFLRIKQQALITMRHVLFPVSQTY